MNRSTNKPLTVKKLRALGRKWQRILRLQDWDVTYYVRSPQQLKKLHPELGLLQGLSETMSTRKEARVHVNPRPIDPPEQVVIHELVHLHLWNLSPDTSRMGTRYMEQVTEALAWALYNMSRKNGGTK